MPDRAALLPTEPLGGARFTVALATKLVQLGELARERDAVFRGRQLEEDSGQKASIRVRRAASAAGTPAQVHASSRIASIPSHKPRSARREFFSRCIASFVSLK